MLFLHFQLFIFIIQNSVVLLGKEDQKQDTGNDINDSCNGIGDHDNKLIGRYTG